MKWKHNKIIHFYCRVLNESIPATGPTPYHSAQFRRNLQKWRRIARNANKRANP